MMCNCNWEEIHGFQSLGEYKRLVKWIEAQLQEGISEEFVRQADPSSGWADRWFRCKSSGAIWKLSCPDPGYFSGTWLPSEEDNISHSPLTSP